MILLIVWLLLTLPIVIEVEKASEGEMGLMDFPIVLFMATLAIPQYYFCVIRELITNKK